MEDFTKIAEQLGLGAVGIILLLWTITVVRSIYEARVADLKEAHVAQLRLLAKVLKLKEDNES